MTIRLAASVVLLILSSLQIVALSESPQLPQPNLPEYFRSFRSHTSEDNLTRVVFRNGLTVVIEEHPAQPFATVATVVEAGSTDRHSTHLECEIVAEILGSRLTDSVFRIGGNGTHRVGSDRTRFFATVPEEEVVEALNAHARLLEWEEVDRKAAAFFGAQVSARTNTAPGSRHIASLYDWAYGERGAPAATSEPSELKRFHELYYHPENVTIAVTGSVRRELVLSQLVELLGKKQPGKEAILAGPPDSRGPVAKKKFNYRQSRVEGGLPVTLFAGVAPPEGHPDRLPLELLQKVLGEGLSALWRLPQDEEEGPFFLLEASLESDPRGDLFVLGVASQADELDRAEARVLALLDALASTGVPASLLDRAKAATLVENYRALESFERRVEFLALRRSEGKLEPLEQLARESLEVGGRRIQEVIKSYLSPENLLISEFLPGGFEQRSFTPESFEETMKILVGAARPDQIGFLEVYRELPGREWPALHQRSYARSNLTRSSVLRGPEIFIRERHIAPVVHFAFLYPGGRIREAPAQTGLTELLLRSMTQGMSRKETGLEALEMELGGVVFETVNEPDYFGFQLSVLSDAAGDVFQRLIMDLRAAALEERSVEAGRLEMRGRAALHPDSTRQEAVARVRSEIFKEHPYGRGAAEFLLNASAFGAQEVIEWGNAHLRQVHPYVIVSGDVEGTSFMKGIVAELSDPDFAVRSAVEARFELSGPPAVPAAVFQSGARQLLGFLAPGEGNDYNEMLDPALRIIQYRLNHRASQAEGPTEWVRLERDTELWAGAVLIELRAVSGQTEQAEAALLEEIEKTTEENLSRSEVLNSLVGTISDFHLRQNDSRRFLRDTMRAVLAKEGADYGTNYLLNIKQMRPGEIEAAVRRYLRSEN